MEPKLSLQWMACTSFVGRVLSLPPSTVFTTGVLADLNHRLESTVPTLATGTTLSHGIQSSRPLVAHFSAQLLLIVLNRLHHTLNEISVTEEAHPQTIAGCKRLRSALLEGARKRLPDVQILLTLRHKVFQGVMKGTELLQCAVLKVIELYQIMLPELLVAAKFDVAKLLPPLGEIELASKRVKLAVVFALSACASALRWWVRAKGNKLTPMGILLRLYVDEKDHAVSVRIATVLESLLLATELFDNHVDEVRVWLQTLQAHPTTAPFLEKVLCQLIEDPYASMDTVNAVAVELQHASARTTFTQPSPPYSPLVISLLAHLAPADSASASANASAGPRTQVGANVDVGAAELAMVAEGVSCIIRTQMNPDALLVTLARQFAVLPDLSTILKPYVASWLKYSESAVQGLVKDYTDGIGTAGNINEKRRKSDDGDVATSAARQVAKLDQATKRKKIIEDGPAKHTTLLEPLHQSKAAVKGRRFPERAWGVTLGSESLTGSFFCAVLPPAGQGNDSYPNDGMLGQLSFATLLDHCNRPGHFTSPRVAVHLKQALCRLPTTEFPAACRQLLLSIRGLLSSLDFGITSSASEFKHADSNSSSRIRSKHYYAIHTCFVLVRQALHLSLRADNLASITLLTMILQHNVIDSHFFRGQNTQGGSVDALLDFHCMHIINDGLSASPSASCGWLPVADMLLTRVVDRVSDHCFHAHPTTGSKTEALPEANSLHLFAIARAASRWFTRADAQVLAQKLLNMPTDKLVTTIIGTTPKLTDIGELLMTLLGGEDASVSRNVTASSFLKLLHLSQHLLCPAVDAAIAALLAVDVDFNDSSSEGFGVQVDINRRQDRSGAMHLDFCVVADEAYVNFCVSAPTAMRDSILAKLIPSNRIVLAAFENAQMKSAGSGFEQLPFAVASYLHSLSRYRQSADPFENYCLPFEASSRAMTDTSALTLDALLSAGIDSCSVLASPKGGDRAALAKAGASFSLVQRLLCTGSFSCKKEHPALLDALLTTATQNLAMSCDILKVCLSLVCVCSKENPATEPLLLVRVLADILAVVVDEGDRTFEDQESVDLPPSNFVLLVWKATAVLSARLLVLSIPADCSHVSPFVLRFQQQVCERWLSYPSAVHAVDKLVCSMCMIDETAQPLATLYERILESPVFETSMAHGAGVIESVDLHLLRSNDFWSPGSGGEDGAEVASLETHARFEQKRDAIAQLLLTVVKTQPAVCTSEQLPRLLQAYNASLAPSDLKIRELLRAYEAHGCPVGGIAAVWGPGSIEMRKSVGFGAGAGAGVGAGGGVGADGVGGAGDDYTAGLDPLEALDRRRMAYSIDHSAFVLPDDERVAVPAYLTLVHQLACYDHEFVLPLLSMMLIGTREVDLRSFVEVGALSYLLVALSAASSSIRSMAYSMVGSVLAMMEESDFRERRQVVVALKALRDAIPEENMSLTPCTTVFVGRAVRIALHPENVPLYPIVNKFLLQRPVLDLDDVPLFYSLFNSSSEAFRAERIWLLRLLAAGLRRKSDYAVFRRRRVFDLLLNLCDSKLADGKTSALSVQVLVGAASIPSAATDLVRNKGFFAWIGTRVSEWCGRQAGSRGVRAFDGFVNIFCSLCRTLGAKPGMLQDDANMVWEEARKVLGLCVRGLALEAQSCQNTTSRGTLRWDLASLVTATKGLAAFFSRAVLKSNEYFAMVQAYFCLYGTSWGQRDRHAAAVFGIEEEGDRLPVPTAAHAKQVRAELVALLPLVGLAADVVRAGGSKCDVRLALIEWAFGNASPPMNASSAREGDQRASELSSSSPPPFASPVLLLRWLRKALLCDADLALKFGNRIRDTPQEHATHPDALRNVVATGLATTAACASRDCDALVCLEELCVLLSYTVAVTFKQDGFRGATLGSLKDMIATFGKSSDIVVGRAGAGAAGAAAAAAAATDDDDEIDSVSRFVRADQTSRLIRKMLMYCELSPSTKRPTLGNQQLKRNYHVNGAEDDVTVGKTGEGEWQKRKKKKEQTK